MRDLTIVIPIYNDAEAFLYFFPKVIQYCKENGCSLVVVNDGSTDDTKDILNKHDGDSFFVHFTHKVNRGYGGAIKTGIRAAQTPYVITIDADGQHQLQDITALYEALQKNAADMVVGNRGKHKENFYRKLGKTLIRFIGSILMPINIQDLNSGIKIYKTSLARDYMNLCPDNMAFSDTITLAFIHHRHLVLEHPITVLPRCAGKSTINTKTALDTIIEILNIVMLFNPLRIFLPSALFFFFLSAAWGCQFLFNGDGVSEATLLFAITGIISFFLGLIAEQLSCIRTTLNQGKKSEHTLDTCKIETTDLKY